MKLSSVAVALAIAAVQFAHAGPLADAVCQTGCNAAVAACYSAAGLVFGAVTTGMATPMVALACNAALVQCQAECAAMAANAFENNCVPATGAEMRVDGENGAVDGDVLSNIKHKLCEVDGGEKPLFGVLKQAAGDLVVDFDGPGRYSAALKSLKGHREANDAVDVARRAYTDTAARVGQWRERARVLAQGEHARA